MLQERRQVEGAAPPGVREDRGAPGRRPGDRELRADGLELGDLQGDDYLVKIISLEAAKIMKIKWLVLGCIEADFCKKIFVRKLLTRSTRFTCFCTAQTSIFQQIFVANFEIFNDVV